LQKNLKAQRAADAGNMSAYIGSPGNLGGYPLVDLTAATGSSSGEIDVVATLPARPTDWTIASLSYCCLPDRLETTLPTVAPTEDTEAVAADDTETDWTISGLVHAASYCIVSWLVWTRPDGRTCYGASLNTGVTAAD
jgi:hypothetical protein